MSSRSEQRQLETRVGLFVLLGFMAIAAFSFKLTDSPILSRGIEVVTFLDDATGLFKMTKIKQAGISIGFVKDIELEQGRAKLTLVIERGHVVPNNAVVVPRPMGILGDKYLEVVIPKPGEMPAAPMPLPPPDRSSRLMNWLVPSAHAQPASPPAPPVKSGAVIRSSPSASSVDDLTREASDVTRDIKASTRTIRTLIEQNGPEIDQTIRSLNRVATKLEKIMSKLDADRIAKDIDDMSQAVGRMSRTVESAESVVAKIDRGEGTVGKLINDPTTANELNRSLSYLNHAIERARRIQTVVDVNGEYLGTQKETKTYIGLTVMTSEYSGYVGQVVVDPSGTMQTVIEETTVNGGPPTITRTVTNDRSSLKFSVQFLRRLGDVAFRLGLFENTGGLGLDFYPIRHTGIQLTSEVYDLGRESDRPHFKAYVRVPVLNFFYAHVGGDDLFTKIDAGSRRRTFMAGVGIRFTDDDLKALLLIPGIN